MGLAGGSVQEGVLRVKIRYVSDGVYYEADVREVDILTDKGLKGDPIPEEEWSQGFRFSENEEEQYGDI